MALYIINILYVCSANPQYSRNRRGEYLYYCVVILYIETLKTRGEPAQTAVGAAVLQDAPRQNISRHAGGV